MEEQDYQANVKAGMEILTEDTWRSRTKLAFRCGIAEGVAQTLLSYAKHLEAELERRTIPNRDLPDLLHSYAESLVDHDSGTIHPSSVLTAYEFLESEGWIEGGRWTEICDRCAPIHCPGSENCSVALDYERAKGGRHGG